MEKDGPRSSGGDLPGFGSAMRQLLGQVNPPRNPSLRPSLLSDHRLSMSSHFPLDSKPDSDLELEAAPSARAQGSRSLRRRVAYGALALWLIHASVTFSATTSPRQSDSSVSSQVAAHANGWKDWVKWHCHPLPKDPKERALALLSRHPIIGNSTSSPSPSDLLHPSSTIPSCADGHIDTPIQARVRNANHVSPPSDRD